MNANAIVNEARLLGWLDAPADPVGRRVTLILDGERPLSWNEAYAGQHWTKRKAEADRIHLLVRAALDPERIAMFAGPVDIVVTVLFASRPLDADNIPAKFYIDALKGWLIADDGPVYVRSVKTVAQRSKANGIVIDVKPAE